MALYNAYHVMQLIARLMGNTEQTEECNTLSKGSFYASSLCRDDEEDYDEEDEETKLSAEEKLEILETEVPFKTVKLVSPMQYTEDGHFASPPRTMQANVSGKLDKKYLGRAICIRDTIS